jgi:ATP-dependent DNA helicase RecG
MTVRPWDDVSALLDQLESVPAAELEGQELDFKEWPPGNQKKALKAVVDAAVCMANGGGGTVVFGVADRARGRERAIRGVPPEVDLHRVKRAVYDGTDPRLTPVIEELRVQEGTGRLLVMHVLPGIPPYTDTSGRGTVRIGTDCQPLTGTLRRRIGVETGESDYTTLPLNGPPDSMLSPAALERLRDVARHEGAPGELLSMSDVDLLSALGVVRKGKLTRAGVLLAGNKDAIADHVPSYLWTHLRMRGAGEYTDRADGRDALPVALQRIEERILADNPIQTVRQGLFHFEYRTFPEIALREALLNAFSHCDYRLGSPILIRQYRDRLEISSPGGFIGGVSPENILHHPPITRNPGLVDALVRLRLVNRSTLGVQRMFHALLIEGKEPPLIEDLGEAVQFTFRASDLSVPVRTFVAEEGKRGVELTVVRLLVLQHLLRHPEVDTATAARICQLPETRARDLLSAMERELEYLERGGAGRGTYWTLRPEIHRRLKAPGHPDRDLRLDWEAAKATVLSVLRRKAEQGEPGLTNMEIRRLTRLDRNQVVRLMKELREEHPDVAPPGRGRYARHEIRRSSQ